MVQGAALPPRPCSPADRYHLHFVDVTTVTGKLVVSRIEDGMDPERCLHTNAGMTHAGWRACQLSCTMYRACQLPCATCVGCHAVCIACGWCAYDCAVSVLSFSSLSFGRHVAPWWSMLG